MADKIKGYPIDCSSILFFGQLGPNFSNVYRFSATLTESVCPETLQQAVERVYPRFPTIFASFRAEFFNYRQVPVTCPPRAVPDPGLLLTMDGEELERCAYRIYYSGCQIIIELFHALTDGYGALMSLRAIIGEYLRLRYGVETEDEWMPRLDISAPDEETRDGYLEHSGEKPSREPGRFSYQLPAEKRDWKVKAVVEPFSTKALLVASKARGVSMTTLLAVLMAESVMEIQKNHFSGGKWKPVRIMVPIDLRRLFPSRTVRNFVLFAMPTLEPEDRDISREALTESFRGQIRQQIDKAPLAAQIARNVRLQRMWLFRLLPRKLKRGVMRLIYQFFGEENSSITVTNLGPFVLSREHQSYVTDAQVVLSPRQKSPYNCALLTCGDVTNITFSRFGQEPELETVFFRKLREELNM